MNNSVDKLYDMVNSFMRMLGEEPFPKTNQADDTMELQSLIDRYVARLRAKQPAYHSVPVEVIPDALLQPLLVALSKMR